MSGWGAIYNNFTYSLRMNAAEMVRLQEQAASGVRVLRASDDPGDAFRILQLRGQSLSVDTYQDNISGVLRNLDQAHIIVTEMAGKLSAVRSSLTQIASGTYSEQNRLAIAEGLDTVLNDVFMWANTQHLGRYLFSGASVLTKPYEAEYAEGKISTVRYAGSSNGLPVPVGPGVEYSSVLVGDELFRCDDRGLPVFLGDTGAAAGSGTSSVRGDVWLTVLHDTTTYGGATGIAPGTSSASGDTIVGDAHTLTIDADAMTIMLDDGKVVAYTGTETDLRLQHGNGDVVYVDVTGLDPALSGQVTVPITATAKLSLDDGASTTDLADFTAGNVAVEDSRTGRVLYVDPRGLLRTGTELVRVPGTYDVFGALINIRDLLTNERGLSESDQAALISEMSQSMDELIAGVTQALTSLGGRIQAIDTLRLNLEDVKNSADDQAAMLQDADVVQVAVNLARAQTFYEMTLAAASKLLTMSLLDYI